MKRRTGRPLSEPKSAFARVARTPARKRSWRDWLGLFRLATVIGLLIAACCAYDGILDRMLYKPALADYRAGEYRAAEQGFREYLLFENDPDAHYYLARTYLAEGKLDQAKTEFLKDLSPRSRGRSENFRNNRRSVEQLRKMSIAGPT